jgi:hypothetical protein
VLAVDARVDSDWRGLSGAVSYSVPRCGLAGVTRVGCGMAGGGPRGCGGVLLIGRRPANVAPVTDGHAAGEVAGMSSSGMPAISGLWPLVGWDAELDLAVQALGEGRLRGLVIAGLPGVGKTRLAREVPATGGVTRMGALVGRGHFQRERVSPGSPSEAQRCPRRRSCACPRTGLRRRNGEGALENRWGLIWPSLARSSPVTAFAGPVRRPRLPASLTVKLDQQHAVADVAGVLRGHVVEGAARGSSPGWPAWSAPHPRQPPFHTGRRRSANALAPSSWSCEP